MGCKTLRQLCFFQKHRGKLLVFDCTKNIFYMRRSSLPPAQQLHILIFAAHDHWEEALRQAAAAQHYALSLRQLDTPRSVLLHVVQELPHLLVVDLDGPASEVQQVLELVERTCPFVPLAGLSQRLKHELAPWQREALPTLITADPPDAWGDLLDWAVQLSQDDRCQARRVRIMQQIERNLRALEEMDSFFEEGLRLPYSFSQQTRREIASSKRYLEALREQLRRRS